MRNVQLSHLQLNQYTPQQAEKLGAALQERLGGTRSCLGNIDRDLSEYTLACPSIPGMQGADLMAWVRCTVLRPITDARGTASHPTTQATVTFGGKLGPIGSNTVVNPCLIYSATKQCLHSLYCCSKMASALTIADLHRKGLLEGSRVTHALHPNASC